MKNRQWMLLLLLGTAESAIAQGTGTLPPRVGAAGRLNAGAPARQMGIRAATNVTYDSNVLGIGRGDGTGRSMSDISITPSLQLDITQPIGRNFVFARGGIGYDFYLRNSRFNRERINLDLGGSVQATSLCAVSPNVGYSRQRSNVGDIFVVTPDENELERISSNVQERVTLGAQASCSRGAGLSVSGGYSHSRFRNSEQIFKFNDLNQDSVDGSIGFQRPSLGRIAVYGNYAEVEYLRRADGVRSYGAGLQFDRNIGSRISASLSGGYSWVKPRSGGGDFSGSSYSARVNLRPTERFSVDLLASRAANFETTVFAAFTITEVYALNGSYRLSPRLTTSFGASQQRRDFRFSLNAPGANPLVIPINDDKFTRAYGGVTYDLNRRLRLNALISQQRRQSESTLENRGRFDFTNTTVTVGASLALRR